VHPTTKGYREIARSIPVMKWYGKTIQQDRQN
jgi:hypothetical protein